MNATAPAVLGYPQDLPGQQSLDTPPANRIEKRDHDQSEGRGMGGLIERMHNVEQRDGRPLKKPKITNDGLDNDEEQPKAIFGGGGKGGPIGEYMKEKRREGLESSGPINAVVDLTGGKYLGQIGTTLR